jgi:FOG: CBS domain
MLMASEIMRRKVITIEPDETIATAISRMIENNIHHLPVTSSKKFLGMIGFDSLLRRSVIPVSTKVSTLMEYGPRGRKTQVQ